ncbi:ATP synthase F1 subunit gamma [Candidatus Daviesbacteria bacterium RIFCSPLOWO2_01_FULL_39_12]|uniref:ATP synthase gamma chain n=1 Tax=Candidatus Daviesbacteria bacterium RIFCSPLOWO2_01_FULL_39_12 TaxID=1797785 RepID=A0A1F5KM31_9BACT|nr:MAG: ATP synthase F1 subunit gamma [Candidatus Daviesbacteria bacterium RIFCSPHIGHO2_02_FULL_39_8]OGE41983.1 MAG: ATP synthase F1 subunit gamma [Candidatus Daviesbacteria bacterium RIFCSPLOWO2_01_FULL_39_12]
MANTRELRRRIKSIKNTSQITKAMQMVAATKMRRAQNQAVSGRPYVENLSEALVRLLPRVDPEAHPLLGGREIATSPAVPRNDKVGIILLSTDKGLVGALNTNLIRTLVGQTGAMVYYTVGRKGRSFVARTGKDLKADFENVDVVTFRQAKQLSRLVIDTFMAGEIGEAYLVYPHFVSTLRQEPRRVKLLPILLDTLAVDLNIHIKEYISVNEKVKIEKEIKSGEFLFEPNADALLDYLLVHHIEEQIYQALLETKASEHSARMIAMQNATDNALELVEDLTLTYNQTRQASITTELLEITTAQVAME